MATKAITRKIPLTRGKFAIIDASDYPLVCHYSWHAQSTDGETWYANNMQCIPISVCGIRGKVKPVRMHRLIMGVLDNPKVKVDHRDGDGLNNRRKNLRCANLVLNGMNRAKQSRGSSSKYKGVFFKRPRGCWVAGIVVYGKKKELGQFDNEGDAARAYDVAAREWFGEFACLNFPKKGESNAHRRRKTENAV